LFRSSPLVVRLDVPSLIERMTMTQEEFSPRFMGSPVERA
jgi:epoxyqueuosine reductase QueG